MHYRLPGIRWRKQTTRQDKKKRRWTLCGLFSFAISCQITYLLVLLDSASSVSRSATTAPANSVILSVGNSVSYLTVRHSLISSNNTDAASYPTPGPSSSSCLLPVLCVVLKSVQRNDMCHWDTPEAATHFLIWWPHNKGWQIPVILIILPLYLYFILLQTIYHHPLSLAQCNHFDVGSKEVEWILLAYPM